jgi:hypothetical protein
MITRTYGGHTDSLFWGATNMLDSVHSGGFRGRYEYNRAGFPVRRSTNGNVDRLWLWNGGQLIAELDSTGTHRCAQYLYHGETDQVYAMVTDSGGSPLVRYIQQDGMGNVTGVMRNTTLVRAVRFTAWGLGEAGWTLHATDTFHYETNTSDGGKYLANQDQYNWVYFPSVSSSQLSQYANSLVTAWQGRQYQVYGPDGTSAWLGNSNTWACTVANNAHMVFSQYMTDGLGLYDAPLQICTIQWIYGAETIDGQTSWVQ